MFGADRILTTILNGASQRLKMEKKDLRKKKKRGRNENAINVRIRAFVEDDIQHPDSEVDDEEFRDEDGRTVILIMETWSGNISVRIFASSSN
ncbi:unnamed protein product [Clavelina lepadiformis]|uniref:Uncharacterized protein n=1 Tax=Clavelina lepadiformis TaxID=159417 RepID=A0ABP0GVE1_CLALP